MRKFTIIHLSDLHMTDFDRLEVLQAGVHSALAGTPQPRILCLTGDLVDSPSEKALSAARGFVDEIGKLFEHTYVIPGNHDVKKWYGSFNRSERFNDVFLTRADLFLREAGLHLIGVDSTSAAFARGGVKPTEYDAMVQKYYAAEMVQKYYAAEKADPDLTADQRAELMRLVAVHHHPLPLAEGEGQRILGAIKDESLMYLESPAQFLDACISCDVSLILHGHRHVQGLVRYSVQSSRAVSREEIGTNDESWDTIYVLSCPSSTGKGCEAGFNVLTFQLSTDGSFADVGRYIRHRNQGPFVLRDDARPNRMVRLLFSKQIDRDVALYVESRLERLPEKAPPEDALFPLIATLFRRQAFKASPQHHWGQLFYAVMKTRLVWQMEVQKRLRDPRKKHGVAIMQALSDLEDFVAFKVLGMASNEPDDIRSRFINDKSAFLHHLPTMDYGKASALEGEREEILGKLRKALVSCGIPAEDFGQPTEGFGGD